MKTLALTIALLIAPLAVRAAPMDTSLDRPIARQTGGKAPKAAPAPEGVETAVCRDGKTYYSPTGEHRGACSGHGGVASWTDGTPVKAKKGSSYR